MYLATSNDTPIDIEDDTPATTFDPRSPGFIYGMICSAATFDANGNPEPMIKVGRAKDALARIKSHTNDLRKSGLMGKWSPFLNVYVDNMKAAEDAAHDALKAMGWHEGEIDADLNERGEQFACTPAQAMPVLFAALATHMTAPDLEAQWDEGWDAGYKSGVETRKEAIAEKERVFDFRLKAQRENLEAKLADVVTSRDYWANLTGATEYSEKEWKEKYFKARDELDENADAYYVQIAELQNDNEALLDALRRQQPAPEPAPEPAPFSLNFSSDEPPAPEPKTIWQRLVS